MNELENLKLQVLALPAKDRTALLASLQADLAPKEQEAIDNAWVVEAIDRLKAYDAGKMEAFTMGEVRKSIGF